jgi:hypothetical protein
MPNQAYPNYAEPAKSHFRLSRWIPVNSGALVGKCTVEMSLMRIVDVMIMRRKDGVLWVALPSRAQSDRDGNPIINTATGKRMYKPVIEWRSKEIADKFSSKVIAALRADPNIVLPDDSAPLLVVHGTSAQRTNIIP